MRHRKSRGNADVEAAIAIEQCGIPAIQFDPFLLGDEHWHARPILAAAEYLGGFEMGRIAFDVRPAKDRASAGFEIVPVDRGGCGETGERIERFGVLTFSGKAAHRADAWQFEFTKSSAIARKHFYLAVRIL